MKLFVGLGNPGARYARNRHNIGRMAVDAIAEAHGFAPWRDKFKGMLAEGRLGTEKVLLLKPETFMNLSGDSVRAVAGFYKIEPACLVVFHDELDLAPGRVRIKTGGGHAGHNGLRSIAAHLGPDFVRVRLGIGHPGDKRVVSSYVLSDLAQAEQAWLEPLLDAVAAAAPALAVGDIPRFLNDLPTVPKAKPRAQTARPATKPSVPPAQGADAPAPAEAPASKKARAGREEAPAPEEEPPVPKEARSSEEAPASRGGSALQRLLDRFR